ncbi:hypothetical protein V6Z11_D06G032800 [Gossypium hirsutum]
MEVVLRLERVGATGARLSVYLSVKYFVRSFGKLC